MRRPFFPFDRKEPEVVSTEFEVSPEVDAILHKLDLVQNLVETLMPNMQDIKDAVQRNTNANQSFTQVLRGLSQQLKEAQAAQDPAAIQEVITQLDANTQGLADAAVAGTPAAGQTPGAPTQPPGGGTPTPPATPPAGGPPA